MAGLTIAYELEFAAACKWAGGLCSWGPRDGFAVTPNNTMYVELDVPSDGAVKCVDQALVDNPHSRKLRRPFGRAAA